MPREISMEKIQEYFEEIDNNRLKLLKAESEDEIERARNFEKHTLNIMNDLIAPLPVMN